ncbi:hypothetical protein HRbin08_01862 [bacterium HR08]|nr:hypothetical protein HRbin08_01862 [bacterium HR08]
MRAVEAPHPRFVVALEGDTGSGVFGGWEERGDACGGAKPPVWAKGQNAFGENSGTSSGGD